jgi:hypothetical protein
MWGKYYTAGQAIGDIVWRKRFARWILKATNMNSEYVILIPFPLQQWLHERFSILRYTPCFGFLYKTQHYLSLY